MKNCDFPGCAQNMKKMRGKKLVKVTKPKHFGSKNFQTNHETFFSTPGAVGTGNFFGPWVEGGPLPLLLGGGQGTPSHLQCFSPLPRFPWGVEMERGKQVAGQVYGEDHPKVRRGNGVGCHQC